MKISIEDQKIKFDLGFLEFHTPKPTLREALNFISKALFAILFISLTSATANYLLFFNHCSVAFLTAWPRLICPVSDEPRRVIVHSAIGLQSTGLRLKLGDKVSIQSRGAVHVAGHHNFNRTNALRCYILKGLQAEQSKLQKHFGNLSTSEIDSCTIQLEVQFSSHLSSEFHRHWTEPSGEGEASNTYQSTKFLPTADWGSLLGVILPVADASAIVDPIQTLTAHGLKQSSLLPLGHSKTFQASSDGYLHLIVNDAVLSPHSEDERSRDFHSAILRRLCVGCGLDRNPRKLLADKIPLYLYADNVGFYESFISIVKE